MILADPRTALDDLDGLLAALDDPHLVQAPRPPVRRARRTVHLLLSRAGGLRLIAASRPLPAAWTIAMIALALAVRY